MTEAAELTGPFEEGGAIARVLPSFRPRPGQQQLAAAIEDCLDEGTDLIAEAATGTGKTLAYLVPVLLRDQRTIISTGTLNLQDQLYWRDLPLAIKALGVERKTALLKGRRNYLCHHRLEQHVSAPERYADFMDELRTVQRWARHTVRGEISEIEEIPSDSRVWPLVTSTPDNCLGKECPFFEDCHLAKARRRAQDADIVVVNHHLLFADMALKQGGFGEVLPGAETVVIDEAHQVPDTAMRFFSRRVSVWQLRELFRETLAAASGVTGGVRLLQSPVAALRSAVDQAVSAFVDLPARGEYSRLGGVVGQLEKLTVALKELAAALEGLEGSSREVDNCRERAVGLHENLAGFLAGKSGHVRWFTNNNGRFQLNLTPLDVSEPLRELRKQVPANWVMTSATLAVKGQFGHYTRRLGLAPETELVIESPFDYGRQSRLWLPDGLPSPGSPAHTGALMEKILPLVAAAGGRTFLLFTSHRALQAAAHWLRANADYNLFVQHDAPRQVLLSRFAKTPRSLLLGAASFWEGVDVPGKALSMVVIDKLPFAAPDDPVLEATLDAVRKRGESPFVSVQLPQAVLALKQGAGRLIRQSDDAGVLVLGDPRLTEKSYGRIFLDSLPPMRRAGSGEEAAAFLRECLRK